MLKDIPDMDSGSASTNMETSEYSNVFRSLSLDLSNIFKILTYRWGNNGFHESYLFDVNNPQFEHYNS